MFNGLIQSTTIPALEQVVNFSQARQNILAGNIANLDTPGYLVRDLSVPDFEQRLSEAIEDRRRPRVLRSPGELVAEEDDKMASVSEDPESILYHDKSNVGMEYQVSEMVKNQMRHNLALTIMVSQFHLLQTAISERV